MARKREGDGWSLIPAEGRAGRDRDSAARAPASKKGAASRAAATSAPEEPRSPAEQRATIGIARRAKGKTVTVIGGLALTENDLRQLGKSLKAACGVGGSVRSGDVELQGDCQDRARQWLQAHGWGLR